MPLSTDVTLPIDRRPEWPSRCVRCGHDEPTDVFRFRASRVGLDQLVTLHFALGSRPNVEVPACPVCTRALRQARLLRRLLTGPLYLIVTVAVLYAVDQLGWLPHGPFRRWAMAGIGLAGISPIFSWDLLHPSTVDATARHGKLVYEFRDANFARDFAELNDAEAR